MAIVKGNTTQASTATSISFSHTQNSGADGLIFCAFYYYNAQVLTNVQYDSVAMTELTTFDTSPSVKVGFYYLTAPSTGSNLVTASMTIGQPGLVVATSLTGCSGIGNHGEVGLANSPHSENITISENSLVYCSGTSTNALTTGDPITIDGNVITLANCDVSGVAYLAQVAGHMYSTSLAAGTIAGITKTNAPSFQVTNQLVEFLESAVVTTRRRIHIT